LFFPMSTNMHKLRELIKIAQSQRAKVGFVDPAAMGGMPPGGGGGMPMDPAMMGGGGGMPMDPAMMGGGMPMDPAMMGGGMPMDPAMMGGAPPPAGVTADEVRAIIQEAMAAQGGGGGGAAGAAGGLLKPKIDVNVEIMQIKNILAKIVDALGIPVPAQDMVATPEKLTEMAQGGGGGAGGSAIPPIQPMAPASPKMAAVHEDGRPYSDRGPAALSGKAAALAQIMRNRN
jgi:hypothetical protein